MQIIYIIDALDGKRYVFPTEKTYYSWYKDFSGVKTITINQALSSNSLYWLVINSSANVTLWGQYSDTQPMLLGILPTNFGSVSSYGNSYNATLAYDVFPSTYPVGATISNLTSLVFVRISA